jgi:hypothetical protein
MSATAWATEDDLHELLSSPLARHAAMVAEALDAPAVLVLAGDGRRPIFATITREMAAARLRGSGLKMPPPGGAVLVFADEQGVIAVARAHSMPIAGDA